MSLLIGENPRLDAYTSRKRYTHRHIFLVLFLITCLLSIGTESNAATNYVYVWGNIYDQFTSAPLKDVTVLTLPKSQIVYSDVSGKYRLKLIKNIIYQIYYLKHGYNCDWAGIVPKSNENQVDKLLMPPSRIMSYVYYPTLPEYPIRPELSDPPVPALVNNLTTMHGMITMEIPGWCYQPKVDDIGRLWWDVVQPGQKDRIEGTSVVCALKGVKVFTEPSSSVCYTDDFGLYTLNMLVPNVEYKIYVQKDGYKLSRMQEQDSFDYKIYKLPSRDFYLNDGFLMKGVTSNPAFAAIYGEKKKDGYSNYALVGIARGDDFTQIRYVINDHRALDLTGRIGFQYYTKLYTDPVFIEAKSTVRAAALHYGFYNSDTVSAQYTVVKGTIAGAKKLIVLCGEIEDELSNNKRTSLRWVNNERFIANPIFPDTVVSLYLPERVSGINVTWPGKPTMTSKISMNSLNPFWDMRTDYTPSEGFRFKVSVDDIDISNDRKTTVQNLGSMEYKITKKDIEQGYVSLTFGAVRRLILLLNDTKTK